MAKRTEDFNRFISDHVNLNQGRLDKLNGHVASVTNYLSLHLEGYLSVERQGSYALRTIIKPHNNHEYDADLLLFVVYDDTKSPRDYIDAIYQCLRDHETYAGKAHRKTRCVVVDYVSDFHLDIVPCISYGTDQFICNRVEDTLEITDGTGFRDWFNRKNKVTNGNLKLVTRLLKHLRDHKQTFTAPSILLTTLIGNAVYDWEDDSNFKTVPDTLVTVSRRINDILQSSTTMPTVANPVLPQEDFTRHWDETKYLNFRDKFNRYTELIGQAYEEDDPQKSLQLWRQLFGENFGSGSPRKTQARAAASSVTVSPRKPYARDNASMPKDSVNRRHSGGINISDSDLEWLASDFPGLRFNPAKREIYGELSFCAAYNEESGKLWIGDDIENRSKSHFLCDTFSISVELDAIDANGWPTVREVGGRHLRIADKERVEQIDLHFFPDGRCCLGINLGIEHKTTIERFVQELLIPFLYRLSFVDAYGIDAARSELWGEYSHGDEGLWQHADDVIHIGRKNPGRNDPCPCGSGKKYKRCHLQEVEAVKVAQSGVPTDFFGPELVV